MAGPHQPHQPHMVFPTFRSKRSPPLNNPQPRPNIPPTPSFGLFLPTPIPASSNLASPYLSYSPAILPAAPEFSRNTLSSAARTIARVNPSAGTMNQPRYSLYEPTQAHEGASAEGGWLSPIPPTPVVKRPLPTPALFHPNPFDGPLRDGFDPCTAVTNFAPPTPTPPRIHPPLPNPPSPYTGVSDHAQPYDQAYMHALSPQHGQIQYHSQPLPQPGPGQFLPTSSTAYCRQIQDMSHSRNTPPCHRPVGPRRLPDYSGTTPMSRGTSSSSQSSSSNANTTDLRRRSALKSLPPSRDYSSSSNQSHRLSLLATINRQPSPPTHILEDDLVQSPPQADFIPDIADETNPTLSWQPEMEEDDEARAVWRKLEERMGRRMHSGLNQQRGRWVVTPAASPMPLPPACGGVEMSPGQFSVSDYMAFGEKAYGDESKDQPILGEVRSNVRGTPYPRIDTDRADIRRSVRTRTRGSSNYASSIPSSDRSIPPHNVLDTLDHSLFPTFPNSNPPKPTAPLKPTKKAPKPKPKPTPKPEAKRNTLCRLDTQVISALEALKSDWASPDLDLALSGNFSQSASPSTPTPTASHPPPPISRPLPLPSLTRRSASPADPQISTPPPLPRPPLPRSPLERGLGLGMSLGTTYNLHSKPTPALTSSTRTPQRKNTRPLPSPVGGGGLSRKATNALSRRSTMRVERMPKQEGMFVIRDLDTGEALEVGVEGLEAALFEMASRA